MSDPFVVSIEPQMLKAVAGDIVIRGAKGDKGDPGDSATIAVGSVTTLAAGSDATVTNSGTSSAAVLNFGIPQGAAGETGEDGVSPTIVSSEITGGHRLTITDASGTSTVDVMDGAKGDPGTGLYISGTVSSVSLLPATAEQSTMYNVGTQAPYNIYMYDNGSWLDIGQLQGPTGATGAAAGFGTPTATIDANTGTPGVTVTASGQDTAKVFAFAFTNLKGATGAAGADGDDGVSPTVSSEAITGGHRLTITDVNGTSTVDVMDGTNGTNGTNGAAAGFGTPTATVDANTGTPGVSVSASGPDTEKVFAFSFTNLKGATGAAGPTGPGVPASGSSGQALRKKSGTDYDTEWYTPPAAGVSTPNADYSTGAAGSSTDYAREDHKHPLNVPTTGTPAMDGTAALGSAGTYARSDHVHPTDTSRAVAADFKAFTVTLSSSSWSSNAQTVSDAKFIASGYSYIISPASSSFVDYGAAQIYADDVSTDGSMTFHCTDVPSSNLTVNVVRVVAS